MEICFLKHIYIYIYIDEILLMIDYYSFYNIYEMLLIIGNY